MKIGNYSADMGESPVGVIPAATLHDAARNKDVGLSIDYPTRGGSFPVIVFSPGYGLSSRAYEPLVAYWVSNGYVVIRPSHADAGQIKETPPDVVPPSNTQNRGGRYQRRPTQQQGTVIPLQQNNPAEQIWDKEREPQWQARAADVELIINSLDKLEQMFPELAGKMDHSKIGVGGHGYGAFTALLVGGVRAGNLSVGDSRVKAIVAFSPPGIAENRGLTAQSFADLRVPVLFMTGSNDRGGTESENADWRKQSFENSPAGDKYFVLIDGARYSSFIGQSGIFANDVMVNTPSMATDPYGRPIMVQPQQQSRGGVVYANTRSIFGTIKITSLAFWDAYLKNDASAKDLLQPTKYDASFTAAHMTAK
jgi:predicted dienelactone hydrolase